MSRVWDDTSKMKNKNQKMQVLKEDLIKYSKQIGILDIEIPELVFYGEEYKEIVTPVLTRHGLSSNRGGRYTKKFGHCSYYYRIIFVNIRANRHLRELRNTLVHELCHYRFRHISHKLIHRRIKLILKGKQYPKKHITYPQVPFIWAIALSCELALSPSYLQSV